MEQFSISLTLGKASEPHGANLAHNNRDFSASNISPERTPDNIIFEAMPPQEAYEILFSESLEAYNAKQKQPCRRIYDYYSHIANGRREEPFYEVIVQFGDCKNAPCGSQRGEIVKEMLIDYMQKFQKRNPNLFVFNAVLHMDEASPHLHIDFVPFYTKGRKNGPQKGVSMRAALEEMGFPSRGRYDSPVIGWEQSERIAMEQILMRRGYQREDKNAHYAHMTVAEYKREQDARKAFEYLRRTKKSEPNAAAIMQSLKLRVAELTTNAQEMKREKLSPYKSFFYTDRDKQMYVQTEMERIGIPFRQTENDFEAQQCYLDAIRKIEKSYKAKPVSARDKLRAEIDRLLRLNRLIRDGATLNSLRRDFAEKEKTAAEKQQLFDKAKERLQYAHDLREKLELLFGGIPSARFTRQQAEDTVRGFPNITAQNWRNVENMVAAYTEKAEQAAADLGTAERELKQAAEIVALAEKVYAGTHVQELIDRENEARLSDYVPNGTLPADNNTPVYRPLRR
ncbi:MAG: plasmid recombination protein [Oscillospiraceae bacterium]|nr:plasmid recombination protein [Oscillospiraceae bacterium]